jgi:uridylate kinase
MGPGKYGIDPETLDSIARQVRAAQELGIEIGIVVGGGNIFRGIAASATSAAGPSATSRRGASSSSVPARATRFSPPTPRPLCAPWRSAPTSS